jgi:hypothetical protein
VAVLGESIVVGQSRSSSNSHLGHPDQSWLRPPHERPFQSSSSPVPRPVIVSVAFQIGQMRIRAILQRSPAALAWGSRSGTTLPHVLVIRLPPWVENPIHMHVIQTCSLALEKRPGLVNKVSWSCCFEFLRAEVQPEAWAPDLDRFTFGLNNGLLFELGFLP